MKAGLIGFLVCSCTPPPASGQTPRANGPFSNLFGANSSATHALDFRGFLFDAYQEELLPPEEVDSAVLDPMFERSQTFAGATGALSYRYNRRGDHSFINVTGFGAAADYSIRPEAPQYSALASASTGVFGQLTKRIRGEATVGASYSPYFGFAPFSPTVATDRQGLVGPQYGFPATAASNIPVHGTVELTDQLSRRSTLSATATWSTLFVLSDATRGFETRTGDVRYTHQLLRRLSIYGGYRYSESRFGDSDQVARSHGADGGIGYGDALTLQLTRRTTASFSGALSSAASTSGSRRGSTTHYAATGSASIHHTMGRTWSAMASYNRSLAFVAFFDQAVLTNTIMGSIAGQVAPRVSWNTTVGWMQGGVGFGDNNHLSASYATSSATVALVRNLGLFAQYTYYRYEVPTGSRFAVRTAGARQIAMAGLTLSVPIFRHAARSPRDTR